jgi:hypothetical protein
MCFGETDWAFFGARSLQEDNMDWKCAMIPLECALMKQIGHSRHRNCNKTFEGMN